MTSNESDPTNEKPEKSSEDDWGDDWGDEVSGVEESFTDVDGPKIGGGASAESQEEEPASGRPVNQVKVRQIGGEQTERLQPNHPTVDKVPRKEIAFEQAPMTRQGIEDKEWSGSKDFGLRWTIPITVAVLGVIIACLVIIQRFNPGGAEGGNGNPQQNKKEYIAELDAALKNLVERKDEARDMYGDFVGAKVIEEILPMIRNSAEMEAIIRQVGHQPLTDKHWVPKDLSKWTWGVSKGKPYAMLLGELPDFSDFRAYFVLHEDHLLIDWKASTAFSTASFSDLAQGKGDTTEIRGYIMPSTFYTRIWPELEYRSFQLESPDGLELLWCYLPRHSDEGKWLNALFEDGEIVDANEGKIPITIKLSRGPEGGLLNQWLIEEIYHREWISL